MATISPANISELYPIEFLAFTVRHPVSDDHGRRMLVAVGHLDDNTSSATLMSSSSSSVSNTSTGHVRSIHMSVDKCSSDTRQSYVRHFGPSACRSTYVVWLFILFQWKNTRSETTEFAFEGRLPPIAVCDSLKRAGPSLPDSYAPVCFAPRTSTGGGSGFTFFSSILSVITIVYTLCVHNVLLWCVRARACVWFRVVCVHWIKIRVFDIVILCSWIIYMILWTTLAIGRRLPYKIPTKLVGSILWPV